MTCRQQKGDTVYLFQKDLPALFKRELGITVSPRTLSKKLAPSAPGRLEPDGYWGIRPIYTEPRALTWAKSFLLKLSEPA
jgi:hypothetical protein